MNVQGFLRYKPMSNNFTRGAYDSGMQVQVYSDCTVSRELRSTELVINKLPVNQLTVVTTLVTANICTRKKE